MLPTRDTLLVLVSLIIVHLATSSAVAQTTMRQWEDEILMMIRDREGSAGGRLFDRGIQRRYTPRMDHEYAIDIRGARFSPEEDARFFEARSGIRSFAASTDKSHFATITDVRHVLSIADRHELYFRGRQQEDLRADRFFVQGGFTFNIHRAHHIGFTQTMGSFKPDLDSEIFYESREPGIGRLRVGVIFLDAFNNLIHDGLGVDPALQDTLRSYRNAPRMIRTQWQSPRLGIMSMEAYIGLQPRTASSITTHSDPTFRLDQNERFGYGLVSVMADWGRIRGSAYIAAWRERSSFRADASSSLTRDYAISQRETWYGLRFTGKTPVSANRRIEVVIDAALNRYRDHQTGDDFTGASIEEAFHLREDRLELEARIGWVPESTGFRASLRWLSDHRNYMEGIDVLERHYLKFAQWSPNSRISLMIGYDYRQMFRLEVGASFDVDGDAFYSDGRGLTRFDGGFGRLQLLW